VRGEPFDTDLAASLAKPAKGSLILERRQRKAEIESFEKGEKAKVVKRDGAHTCRLVPNCPEKEKHETAHVAPKGMGGDRGNRSDSSNMVRSCLFHHRGRWSLHAGYLRVEFLTDAGADGPLQVWAKERLDSAEYLLKRELACNLTERD
jgi:hypothetical protein